MSLLSTPTCDSQFTPLLGEYCTSTTSVMSSFPPMHGKVSSAWWLCGVITNPPCLSTSLGTYSAYSKIRSQTQGDFTSRQGKARQGYPSNVKGWNKNFFFISGDDREFSSRISRDEGVPWVPRSWNTLSQYSFHQLSLNYPSVAPRLLLTSVLLF